MSQTQSRALEKRINSLTVSQVATLVIARLEVFFKKHIQLVRGNLHMLQGGMENHTPNSKYHIGYVQDTEPFLKTLAESIH